MGQRYQREIEEILGKVNEDAPAEGASKRTTSASRERRGRQRDPIGSAPRFSLHFSPGKLLAIGLGLLVAAWLLSLNGVGFAAPLVWIGIALLIAGYVLVFTRPRRRVERRWRGQSLEDPPEPGGLARIWRWLTRG